MSTRDSLVEALRALISRSDARTWLGLAVLFGSRARGTTHEGSDVDVGVFPDARAPSLAEELALEEALCRSTGLEVDLVRLDGADAILRHRAAREGVVVFESRPGALARFAASAALEYLDLEPLLVEGRKRYLRRVGGGS